jgi:pilus assembly protein CpaB
LQRYTHPINVSLRAIFETDQNVRSPSRIAHHRYSITTCEHNESLQAFQEVIVRTSTFVTVGFAALFGMLAVFLAQTWLNNKADQQMRSLEALRKSAPPVHTIVVASQPLRFGDEVSSRSLREVPWPSDSLPAGAFRKIADLTSVKRVVIMPIEPNEAILASKITGPGQRATLSATLQDGLKAVTIRVNDVEGVAGFVLPGDHVDVVVSRPGDQNFAMSDVVMQNARVLAVDQMADERAEKPSVVKAVTLEVDVTSGQKLALASLVGTLSLMLRKAGEVVEMSPQRITLADIGQPPRSAADRRFVTIGVTRALKRQDYSVPVEGGGPTAALNATLSMASRSAGALVSRTFAALSEEQRDCKPSTSTESAVSPVSNAFAALSEGQRRKLSAPTESAVSLVSRAFAALSEGQRDRKLSAPTDDSDDSSLGLRLTYLGLPKSSRN